MLRQTEREIRELAHKSRWPELVIFDCDGVLVDSEVIALGVTRRRLGEAGLRLTDEETRERFLGMRLDSVLRIAEAELGAPLPKEFPDDLSHEILTAFAHELKGVERVRAGGQGFARARVRRLFERAGKSCVSRFGWPATRACSRRTFFPPPRSLRGSRVPIFSCSRRARWARRRKTAW